jgi:1-acyl-sn-glycerol-3-phosphate acyltransferase
LRILLRFVWAILYRVRYTGQDNVPAQGAVLVVSNHQSHFDPPLVGAGCSRRMNYLARESLFRFGPLAWLMRSLDAIPIDLEGSALAGIKEALRRLKRGELVLVFPEGTRTSDGQIRAFMPGFVALARRGRAAILPVAIDGAHQAWPRWRALPGLGTLQVHYGNLLTFEEVARLSDDELTAEVERRVRTYQAHLRRKAGFAAGCEKR